jgi:rhodanese-related sulfurtransferase
MLLLIAIVRGFTRRVAVVGLAAKEAATSIIIPCRHPRGREAPKTALVNHGIHAPGIIIFSWASQVLELAR